MAHLNKDYVYKPSNYEREFVIPKGTRITHRTALGIDPNYNFVDDLSWIPKECPLLKHDATYYGINVPKEYVDEN